MNRRFSWMLALGLVGCATASKPGRTVDGQPSRPPATPTQEPAPAQECPCRKAAAAAAIGPALETPAPDDHGRAAVPVTADDPVWGNPDAPVTVVEFSDFQCPFCALVQSTLSELKRSYGPSQLRVVWKNYPLPFHPNARPAADAAMGVRSLGGNDAFWKFHDLAFAHQDELSGESYVEWAAKAGVDGGRFVAQAAAPSVTAKVDRDIALARGLSIRGTPMFLINGVALAGALPIERFRTVIARQLAAAEELRAQGVAAHAVYPILCTRNLAEAASPEGEPSAAGARGQTEPSAGNPEATVWSVPIRPDDPAVGPTDAPVTLVEFSDFECPYCEQLAPILAGLIVKYSHDLRVVWKDYPLPFHTRAVPSAVLARVALAKKGPGGFWQAHDALFARHSDLDDRALRQIAKQLGLGWSDVRKAIADRRFQRLFDENQELGEKLAVQGTPTSFINGRKVVGTSSGEAFSALIDAELARARAKAKPTVVRGVPQGAAAPVVAPAPSP